MAIPNNQLYFPFYQEDKQRPFRVYRVRHLPTEAEGVIVAQSAQEACMRLEWWIGDCYIQELGAS